MANSEAASALYQQANEVRAAGMELQDKAYRDAANNTLNPSPTSDGGGGGGGGDEAIGTKTCLKPQMKRKTLSSDAKNCLKIIRRLQKKAAD